MHIARSCPAFHPPNDREETEPFTSYLPLSASVHAVHVALVARGPLGSSTVAHVALFPSASESLHKQRETPPRWVSAAHVSWIAADLG